MTGAERWKQENEGTRTVLEWSEFHYHLFSHLISDDCPRDLAQDVELACFAHSWVPQSDFLEQCVQAGIGTEDPEEFNLALRKLVALAKQAYPNHGWKTR